MKKVTRESIINTYNTLNAERGGVPIGERVFVGETGISRYHWQGGFWRSWSAFQAEAGHAPNSPTLRIDDEIVLRRFAELASELKAIPTEADLVLNRKQDLTFPSKLVFRRWGTRAALLAAVAEYCEDKEELSSVVRLLDPRQGGSTRLDHRLNSFHVSGFVYLIRSGKHYKLGRTNAAGRRLRELSIQLPDKPDTVHVIETDDPEGIEQYWHRRFADKRQGGEWFDLTTDDVRAFKKRGFQ